jgi:hypothetical protein
MQMSMAARIGALLAAAMGAGGIYYESTPLILASSLGAVALIVQWLRWTAPHDHWRAFRRRHPSDP